MAKIIQSSEEINVPDQFLEAGDLANEVGKKLMKDLFKSIERYANLGFSKLYFLTGVRKDPTDIRKIHLLIQPLHHKLKFLRESYDFWEYNYLIDKLELIWSVPHITEMKNFLRAPDKYSPKLIQDIKSYLKQENIDLKSLKTQKISS